MAANKTQPTSANVQDYIESRAREEQKADCKSLMTLFHKLTKLGPHSHGKSCLYIRRLADIDIRVFETVIVESISNLPH